MSLHHLAPFLALALTLGSAARAGDAPGDVRDVLLLLPEGPLHLRFHVALDGKPLSARRAEYIDTLMQRLDGDGDGKVSHAERQRSPLFTFGRRSVENEFLASLRRSNVATRADFERDLERFGGLFSFREDDTAALSDDQVFLLLDEDQSQRVEPREMRIAVVGIAGLDGDRDQCVSFDEFNPRPDPPVVDAAPVGDVEEEDAGPPPVPLSKTMQEIEKLTLSRDLLAAYDRNRDRGLSAEELGCTPAAFQAIDANHDGRADSRELQRFDQLPIDLELSVDVAWKGEAGTPLRVVSSAADRQIPAPRPDLVRIVFGRTTVTFAFRQVDPIESALQNAMQKFNLLDGDANGYVDLDEVAEEFYFRRNLFDGIDADGDQKVFAEEMQTFVAAVAEPAATTCHVNVYDTGRGFFQMLDTSGDGRISIRELRTLEQSLLAHEPQPGRGIGPDDLGRSYHVEFLRGTFHLFGASQRLVAQGPTFIERDAIGPSWFQGMDRNRDGDLTYLVENPLYPPEFLGHPEDAATLDQDGDGLISVTEALQYEQRLSERASASHQP